jgi:hypothetical protein
MSGGFATNAGNSDLLIRSEVWSTQLKDVLLDELMAQRYVRWLTEFPDGDEFTIPSIGEAQVDDYVEGESVKYRALDTGEFKFQITDYVATGHAITDKAKQDIFYMNELVSSFVPKQARAISTRIEKDILALANQQQANDTNSINGAEHRFVASGTNEVIEPADFAKARFALKKANVPDSNLIAIVDPSVEYRLNTLSNLVSVSDNPRWEGIVADGIASGMKFIKNVYGFDVWTSNYLPTANETIGGLTTASGKANIFFSATPDILPFIGAMRQTPTVEAHRDSARKSDMFDTTARYGLKLFRPENLVVVLSDDDQV